MNKFNNNSKKTLARKLLKTLNTAEQIDGHSHPEEVETFHGTIFPIFWMKINSIHAENLGKWFQDSEYFDPLPFFV